MVHATQPSPTVVQLPAADADAVWLYARDVARWAETVRICTTPHAPESP